MTKTGRFLGMLLLPIALACSNTHSLNLGSGPDAGKTPVGPDSSVTVSEDAQTTGPDLAAVSDMKPASDTVPLGPETGRADATPAVIDSGEIGGKPDTKTGSKLDTADPTTAPDAEGPAPLDAKPRSQDVGTDLVKTDAFSGLPLAGDAGIQISGIEVLPYKNFTSVDSACAEGTTSWVSTLTNYLAEDRKCWSDTDCQYASFSNSCGVVCSVPINVQRIGEFSNYAIGGTDQKCSTCPQLKDMPICAPPPGDGSAVCNNNLCVWK